MSSMARTERFRIPIAMQKIRAHRSIKISDMVKDYQAYPFRKAKKSFGVDHRLNTGIAINAFIECLSVYDLFKPLPLPDIAANYCPEMLAPASPI